MSKQIHQYLVEHEIFRSMWADDYSTVDDMVERFKDEFNAENFDNIFKNEVYCAINSLDTEMKELFLAMRYPSKD